MHVSTVSWCVCVCVCVCHTLFLRASRKLVSLSHIVQSKKAIVSQWTGAFHARQTTKETLWESRSFTRIPCVCGDEWPGSTILGYYFTYQGKSFAECFPELLVNVTAEPILWAAHSTFVAKKFLGFFWAQML